MAPNSIPRYGNAPGIDSRPEPYDSPSSDGVGGSFGGAPTVDTLLERGEKQVGGPGADIWPTPYGGGAAIEKRKGMKSVRGSGDGTGAGDTGSATIP